MADQKKEKNLSQQLSEAAAKALTKPVEKFIAWGSENAWKAVVVVAVLAGAGGVADHYLGIGNAISEMFTEEQAEAKATADPSATAVVAPATIEP